MVREGWVRGGVVRTGAAHLALPRTFPRYHADPGQSGGLPGEKGSLKPGGSATDEESEALVKATAPPQSRNRRYLLAPRAARS